MSDVMASARDVFVVEAFVPASDGDAAAMADRVRAACAELRATGVEVAYLGALMVTHDELAFHVMAAEDPGAVLEASRRAHLAVERVVASVAICATGALPTRRQALRMDIQPEGSIADEARELGAGADPQL